MAIALEDKQNVDPPSALYPNGNIRDNDGSGNGTPVNKINHADFHQFFARLLVEGNVVPNGQPDNAYDGFQYIEALVKLIRSSATIEIEIGAWNMDTTAFKAVSLAPYGLDWTRIRWVKVMIFPDSPFIIMQPLDSADASTGAMDGDISGISAASGIVLHRLNSGAFDSAIYSDPGTLNRGIITIGYDWP